MRRAAVVAIAAAFFAANAQAQDEPPPNDVELPATPAKPKAAPKTEERAPPCEQAFIEHVYKATKPSVVRITRPDGGLGTGFVFHDNRHVATALHVVDLGRDLKVEFPGGKMVSAEVAAVDEGHDLAILTLSEPTDAPPLLPGRVVNIGAPVLAIGNPYGDLARQVDELEGLLNFSVSQGIISAKSEAYIQTDAVLSPGNSGGPMLTCDGRVVGIADKLLESRIGFGVPVAHLTKLVEHIGERKYRGRWTTQDIEIGLLWQSDKNSYLGAYVGGSAVGYDRIAITTRVGVDFAGKGDTKAAIVDKSMHRFFGELTVGYRFLLMPYTFPFYVTLAGGALGTIDRGDETRLSISSATPPTLAANTSNIRGGGVEPLITALIDFAGVEASYGFALDVIHPKYSMHQVLLGLVF